jgi:tetratricopeptide (TPR) repeat protein
VQRNPTVAQYRYMLASVFAERGDLKAAATNLEDGLEIDQRQELAYARLARILAAAPTAEARRNLLDLLLAVAPDHPTLRAAKARFLIEQSDYSEAIATLTELAEANPEVPTYTLWLAEAVHKAGRNAQAQQVLRDWLGTHPKNVAARLALAEYAIDAGDHDAAIEQYRRVLELNDKDPVALNNLAMLLADADPDEAMALADRALALKPDDAAYIDTKATVLLAKGDYAAAVELLAKAHAGSADPSIAFRYATALAKNGDADAARRVLLSIQAQSFPEKAEADALLARLTAGN